MGGGIMGGGISNDAIAPDPNLPGKTHIDAEGRGWRRFVAGGKWLRAPELDRQSGALTVLPAPGKYQRAVVLGTNDRMRRDTKNHRY